MPLNQDHPYLIFDQEQKQELDSDEIIGKYESYVKNVIEANSVEELAEKIGVEKTILQNTLITFNKYANQHKDPEFHRDPSSMRAFEGNKIYAVKMVQTVLNTQGGPRRNKEAEILNTKGEPIHHLYSAGEFGGISVNQYQAGGNLAECLIWGKIAGENAARIKKDNADVDTATGASERETHLTSDITPKKYATKEKQYIGRSSQGMGDEIVVRVTVDEQKNLKNIEVLKQEESEDYGLKAIKILPVEMVKQNKVEVDAVSGASNTSRGLKKAVKDALSKAK